MKTIDPKTASAWLHNNEAFLIDVREQHEFDECHIEGATLAPLSVLPETIQQITIPTDKKIIMQCLKGGRSAQAIDYLSQNILKDHDVYNMDGGILLWVEHDLPVAKS